MHDAQAHSPYLFLLPPHNFTLLCISTCFPCLLWSHRICNLFAPFLFFNSSLLCPLFSLHNLVPVSTVCAVHFSIHLVCPVTAVLRESARQLIRKTVRSMIITFTIHFTPCVRSRLCQLPAFSYTWWDFVSSDKIAFGNILCFIDIFGS